MTRFLPVIVWYSNWPSFNGMIAISIHCTQDWNQKFVYFQPSRMAPLIKFYFYSVPQAPYWSHSSLSSRSMHKRYVWRNSLVIELGASRGFKVLRLLRKTTSNERLLPRHAKIATKCALEKLIFSAGESSSSSLMTSFRKTRELFSVKEWPHNDEDNFQLSRIQKYQNLVLINP